MSDRDTDEPSSSEDETKEREQQQSSSPIPEVLEGAEQEARISYYVQVWDEMLDTVLGRESYLFTKRELATIQRFQSMSYPARYLFIRLFVRRRGFFRLSSLNRYDRDVPDVHQAAQELCAFASFADEARAVRESTPPQRVVIVIDGSPEAKPARSESDAQPTASTSAVTLEDAEAAYEDALGVFAENEKHLFARSDLEELAGMVSMEELKTLARQMSLDPPKIKKNGKVLTVAWTRASIIKALKSQSGGQSTLFSFSSATTKTKTVTQQKRTLSLAFSGRGKKRTQADLIAHKLMHTIGPVIKLDDTCIKLFLRLHLVFHRCAQPPSQNTLTNALLSRFEKRSYPEYPISRQFTIFPDRAALLAFERAVRLEEAVEAAIEVARSPFGGYRPSATTNGGTVKKPKKQLEAEVEAWQKGRRAEKRRRFMRLKDLFEASWTQWTVALQKERQTRPQVKDPRDPDDRLTYYMRRFTPGWALTHCVFKSMDALAYFHLWDREAEVLRALLDQTYFCRGRRGKWWDRLALILMEHGLHDTSGVKQEEGAEAKGEEESDDDDVVIVSNSKMPMEHCRREALKVCWKGLDDKWCHLVERHSLQRRVARLESMLKVPQEERHVFPAQLNAATDIIVEGEQLGDRITGKKAWWKSTLDPTPEEEALEVAPEVSVEELSLQHYRAQGWQGVHSENTVLTMLFGMLFFDILFTPVEGAFETRYQSEPLDLRSDAFAIVRHDLIWERLAQVRDGETAALLKQTDDRERPRGTWCVGVRWDAFSADEVQEVARCIGDEALAIICQVYAEDYEHRAGGVPDLFLWNPKKSKCKFSEVKGPGDRISKTQKVWIDVLLSAGLKVDKCSVKDKRTMKKKRAVKVASESASEADAELGGPPPRKRRKSRKTE